MDKYTRFPYLKLILSVLLFFSFYTFIEASDKYIRFKGEYFLFSDEANYLYGTGKIIIKHEDLIVKGEILYYDIQNLRGALLGNIELIKDGKKQTADSFFFKGVPLKYYTETYNKSIEISNNNFKKKEKIEKIKKRGLNFLKKAALYYEFTEFKIGGNKKIKARNVIPYIMGLPSLPFKKFTIKRGDIPEKTLILPMGFNYSGEFGLILSILLRLRSKTIRGENTFKFFEKGLFNLGEPKRGLIFSGKETIYLKKNKILDISLLANSNDETFNIVFEHHKSFKHFTYNMSHTVSGRKDKEVFNNLKINLLYSGIKNIKPNFSFTHNMKNSYSYGFNAPIDVFKRLKLNFGVNRKIFKDSFTTDTFDFSSSITFRGNFFNLSSNYNTSKNMIEASLKKNFSFNLNFNTLYFLDKNMSIDFSTFYMMSAMPTGKETLEKISPGMSININAVEIVLPLGLSFSPVISINQIWDNQSENYTDSNISLSLKKQIGVLVLSTDYSFLSHYKSDGFWVEGYNRKTLNFNVDFKKEEKFDLSMKLLTGNELKLETILFTGKIFFPNRITLSSYMIYYYTEKKLQTMEIFLEKNFRNVFKLQGGYSLALKKFFIKALTL